MSSSFNSRARGVAILINKNTPLEILDTDIDSSGRYVFVNCRIFSEQWSLLNLYAPNYDDEVFMQNMFLKVAGGQQNILMGGTSTFAGSYNGQIDKEHSKLKSSQDHSIVYERSKFNRHLEADAPSDPGLFLLFMPS